MRNVDMVDETVRTATKTICRIVKTVKLLSIYLRNTGCGIEQGCYENTFRGPRSV